MTDVFKLEKIDLLILMNIADTQDNTEYFMKDFYYPNLSKKLP